MTYSVAGDDIVIIDHTEVDLSLRGTGAGQALVAAAVAWARDSSRRILPLCPFARSVFERTPDTPRQGLTRAGAAHHRRHPLRDAAGREGRPAAGDCRS